MLDLEEARIERETSKMDFRRLCEQVHFFSRRSQKNPEDTMPSASLLRSSRTLPPVTFSPRRATTRFSRHPVRAFKEGARCFVLLRELAIRERAGGDDAATGQKRGFHVFFSPLGHVSLSLAPPQGTTSVHGTTFPLRFYACTLDVDRLFLRERKLETKRTLTIDLPSSLFFFDADEKPKKKKKPERSFFASTAAAPTSSSSARCRFPEQQQQHRPDPDPLLDPRRRQRPHPRLRGRPRPGPPGERERVFFFFFKEKKKKNVPGTPPPLVSYTREETAVWSEVFDQVSKLYPRAACDEFLRSLPALGFERGAIPQLRDVSEILTRATGWQVRPVAGLMHPRDFLAGLAFKTFHSTQYLRHGSRPSYTPVSF